ncbi:MAG: PLP-dependent transferase [Planctomycetia bacterium]|nr:PLP-dependent transferase [Planctomycetia bacterium]
MKRANRKAAATKPAAAHRPAYGMETFLVHGRHHTKKWDYTHHLVPPISSSAAYRLGSAERGALGFESFAHEGLEPSKASPIYIYDRLDEPVRGMLEESLAEAERGEFCAAFATGMAAVSGALGVLLQVGDEIVCHRTLYGCSWSLFRNWYPRLGIKVVIADLTKPGALAKAMTPKTRAVYFESPANPTMELIDIGAVRAACEAAARKGRPRPQIVIDNTFATPFCQRPLTLGADMVVHSLTKNLGGFGTDMGGAVVTRKEYSSQILLYRKDFGGVLAPKSAWPIFVYGFPTLPLRMKQQQESARRVADFLERHPKVRRVAYPGLPSFPQYELARQQMTDYSGAFAPGSMLYFTVKGDANHILNYVARQAYAVTLAVSLGQTRTLIESPTQMTHATLSHEDQGSCGLEGEGLRLSLGLESVNDILSDLERALAHA